MPAVAERTRPAAPGLRASLREFASFPTARVLAATLIVCVAFRVWLGAWRWRDLVVGAAFVVLQPFSEWVIHVYVLHWRTRSIGGRQVDLKIGRMHRRHHQAPKDPRYLFIPMRTIRVFAVLDAALLLLAWAVRPSIATGVTAAVALTLVYEWTHWLIHSDYQPRSPLYRGLWRAHRLHHFRNENYWFGVTGHLGDRVLRTYPAKEDVPLSPTATTLGIEV